MPGLISGLAAIGAAIITALVIGTIADSVDAALFHRKRILRELDRIRRGH